MVDLQTESNRALRQLTFFGSGLLAGTILVAAGILGFYVPSLPDKMEPSANLTTPQEEQIENDFGAVGASSSRKITIKPLVSLSGKTTGWTVYGGFNNCLQGQTCSWDDYGQGAQIVAIPVFASGKNYNGNARGQVTFSGCDKTETKVIDSAKANENSGLNIFPTGKYNVSVCTLNKGSSAKTVSLSFN